MLDSSNWLSSIWLIISGREDLNLRPPGPEALTKGTLAELDTPGREAPGRHPPHRLIVN